MCAQYLRSKRSPSRFVFYVVCLLCIAAAALVYLIHFTDIFTLEYVRAQTIAHTSPLPPPVLDKAAYDAKMLLIAHPYSTSTATATPIAVAPAASTTDSTSSPQAATSSRPLWPVRAPYPNYGAILPFHRIIAYYGNFYSKGMGVLGQYPEAEMLAKFQGVIAQWNAADPTTPVMPAIDYIAVTAQASAGADGMYRARMPDSQIDYALELAQKVNGIVILEEQVGLSTLQKELPLLEKYLKNPRVHLAIDPEFSMKSGARPGTEVGTFDAKDINYAANYLASLVRANNLPPKILIVHRYTREMVTHAKQITPLPEVQIVMDMDGWGAPEKKITTYNTYIYPEPVQFTGFKLFYKNDILPPSTRMLTPLQILSFIPQPVFIQYQ